MPPFRPIGLTLLLVLVCGIGRAETLKITSAPSGATVEINGVVIGVTPIEKSYPGGYFHKTITALGARLEHPMVARISLQGYATREIPLTEGPMHWVDLHGRSHGEYYLFKNPKFQANLDPIATTFTGSIASIGELQPAGLNEVLSDEQSYAEPNPRFST
jgi:PEGA domain